MADQRGGDPITFGPPDFKNPVTPQDGGEKYERGGLDELNLYIIRRVVLTILNLQNVVNARIPHFRN